MTLGYFAQATSDFEELIEAGDLKDSQDAGAQSHEKEIGAAVPGCLTELDQGIQHGRVDVKGLRKVYHHDRRAVGDRKGVDDTMALGEVKLTVEMDNENARGSALGARI
jgi:hypothetical protein